MLKHSIFYLLFIVFWHASAYAEDYVTVESGGLKGLMHINYGIAGEQHSISAGIGFVPHRVDHDAMTLLSLNYMYALDTQYDFSFFDSNVKVNPFNFGASILYSSSDRLFLDLPEGIPDGYYAPTAIRILFNYRAEFEMQRDTSLYLTLSVVDVGLANYIRNFSFYRKNYDFIGLSGITNVGFGFKRTF